MPPRPRVPRKLLVASLGVAAVSYVACGQETSGNLVAPPQDASLKDVQEEQLVANLLPPPMDAGLEVSTGDAGADAADDAQGD